VNVLLVANNPSAEVPSSGYDLYVHFNTIIHWGKTPFEKSIVAVRKNAHNEKMRSFHHNKNGYIHVPTNKLIAIGWHDDVRSIDQDIEFINLLVVPNYRKGYSPTSGFTAIYYYLERGDNVTLCGFDLTQAHYYKTTGLHLPDYEISEIEKMVEAGIVDRCN
jgi:hypothetical protein